MGSSLKLDESRPVAQRLAFEGTWFFQWGCSWCMDSGLVADSQSVSQCPHCEAKQGAIAYRLFGAVSLLQLKNQTVDRPLLNLARAIVSATAEQPMPGEALAFLLHVSPREIKDIAKRLRDEWRLPVMGSRRKPYGYFIAANAEQFLEWGRVTRSQAISELATFYKLFKANFPELAGQQPLLFVSDVSTDLEEAIR